MKLKKIIIILVVVFVGLSVLNTGQVSIERGYNIIKNDIRKVGKVGNIIVSFFSRGDDIYDEVTTMHSTEPPIYDYTWGQKGDIYYLIDSNDPDVILFNRYIKHHESDGHYRFSLYESAIDMLLLSFPRKSDIHCGGR